MKINIIRIAISLVMGLASIIPATIGLKLNGVYASADGQIIAAVVMLGFSCLLFGLAFEKE